MSTMAKVPEVEVTAKAQRRRFTAEYKRKVLKEADDCTKAGELAALLRREGLYSSNLIAWRRQRETGELSGLEPKKRGRKVRAVDERDSKIAELEREVTRLLARTEQAEAIIEVQKKVSQLFAIRLPDPDSTRRL
jgi:transposase